MCIQSIHTEDSADFTGSTGTWQGGIFLHAENWTGADGTSTVSDAPLDVYVQLGDIDCASTEDASWWADEWYCQNWSEACDGVDNDFDGVIDEGQSGDAYPYDGGRIPGGMDADGNGVADCQDDWDGDGVPNFEEPDITQCCCYKP